MNVSSAIAIYFIVWWIALFLVLPWGVRSQADIGDVVPGTDPGAPARPRLLFMLAVNTLLATVLFGLMYVVWVYRLITLDSFWFLPGGPTG